LGLRPRYGVCRPVDRSHIPRPSKKEQKTYGRPVCARQAFAPAGHAGLSDALRTVETASTVGGHRPLSLLPGAQPGSRESDGPSIAHTQPV
jgi:hypothetical protein